MARFVGLAVGGDEDWAALTEAQVQAAVTRYVSWATELGRAGYLVGGGSLDNEGRMLSRQDGEVRVETLEMPSGSANHVRGWSEVEAETLDIAVSLFADHPHLEFGKIEVHPVTQL